MPYIKRTTSILLLCLLVLLTGCEHEITLWRPDSGVWYCDELEMQLSFDKSTPYCFVVQDGTKIECTWENDRGANYIAVMHSWETQKKNNFKNIEIFCGTCIELTDEKYVLEEVETGTQYTFYPIA